MKIIIDHREPIDIIDQLKSLGVRVTIRQLDVADYIISDRLAIERKTCRDLVQSLYDNRLFNQVQKLTEDFEQVVLIVEDWDLLENEYRSIFGAISYLSIRRNLTILPTGSKSETSHLIERLTSWEQEEHTDPVLNRPGSKGMDPLDRQLFILQGLEGVGQKTAKMLLDHIGTPSEIFNAIRDSTILYSKTGNPKGITGPLASVKGIGPKFILNNQSILTNNFKK